jgi:2-dehydropantoate 2-reductase
VASIGDIPRGVSFDLALLVMKAQTVVEAARATVPLLEGWGYVVTCQNGIVEDAVGGAIGAGKVVSAMIGWGATMLAPGVYEKTGPGPIHVGEMDGDLSDRVRDLARVLEHVSPVVLSRNMRGTLWSKLAINSVITTLGALTGETLGQMLARRQVRDVALELYSEVVDTAEACGVELEWIYAPPGILYLPRRASRLERALKDMAARFIARRYGRLRSSMLQSLERGRPTEIDTLNGYVVERARERGVEVPVNERLVAMIRQIESGERRIDPGNMAELVALTG